MSILYSIIATFIGLILLQWTGFLRWAIKIIKHKRAISKYKNSLAEECGFLIVIGKKTGFKIQEVYVPLDIAPSDLMHKEQCKEDKRGKYASSYVLVGGPGAGKSTSVKQMMLEELINRNSLPFFLRLRDHVGFDGIEQHITHKLNTAGFSEPEKLMQELLSSSNTLLCILDGLDEVRPQLRDTTVKHINNFYHKYFTNTNRLIVTCRKEAYRRIPLDIPIIKEVRPLSDGQIQSFANKWPLVFPQPKNAQTFWRDLNTTPRILELARSPLLLVGGLMQYTESNLGIPEERYEYLARVAKWLTVEWSTAQGYPPDPNRQVYDRLLARLAYYLHNEQLSEIERGKASELFTTWLPMFGRDDINSDDIIEQISTRTGILVSNDKNYLVFAQFGLQEYFASLEIATQVGPEGLATLEPIEWWREIILLSIAQEREPSTVLSALFVKAPLIAAAAVAECPTPSTEMQDKAIEACLSGIDTNDKEAGSSSVALLRKVQGTIETKMCSMLEERLQSNNNVTSVVGIALALAGTSAATNTLARHPEIWDQCLKEAGYLSANFENLLINWIQTGSDFQSQKASELIISRLTGERFQQLLELIPSLDIARGERLASLLLDEMGKGRLDNSEYFPSYFFESQRLIYHPAMFPRSISRTTFSHVTRCCAYIKNRDAYMLSRLKTNKDSQDPIYFRFRVRECCDLISTCLYLEDKKGNRLSESSMNKSLCYAIAWTRKKTQLVLLLISIAIIGTMHLPHYIGIAIILIGILVAATLIYVPIYNIELAALLNSSQPRGNFITAFFLIIASTTSGILFFPQTIPWLQPIGVFSIVACFIILGIFTGGNINYGSLYSLRPITSQIYFSNTIPTVFIAILAFLGTTMTWDNLYIQKLWNIPSFAAGMLFLWIISSSIKMIFHYRIVKKASVNAATALTKLSDQ